MSHAFLHYVPWSILIHAAVEKPGFHGISMFLVMPLTSEKLRGHIGLGLSVRLSVSPSVRNSLAAEKLKNRLCWNLEMWHVH